MEKESQVLLISWGSVLTENATQGGKELNKCKTCIHWNKTNYSDGLCSEIKEKVYIDVKGDGYLDYIETEEDFGCTLWKEK